jgi:hypothetical protein
MRKALVCLTLFAATIPATHAAAGNVDFSLGINIGSRPHVAVPILPAPPVYHAPPITFAEPPLFIAPPQLGFHVAVGIPHDMFYVNNTYYLLRDNAWFVAANYTGPWTATHYRALPGKLRRHPYETINYYRHAAYRDYRRHHNHSWRNHHYRPPHREWREARYERREDTRDHWRNERGHDYRPNPYSHYR